MSKRKIGFKMTPAKRKRPTWGKKPTKAAPAAKKRMPSKPTAPAGLSFSRQIEAWISPWTRRMSALTKRSLLVAIGAFLFGGLVSYFSGIDPQQSLLRGLAFAVIVAGLYYLLEFSISTAEKKGYSWWLGLLLFIVPPVVGVVIVLLLPPKQSAPY